MGFVDVVGSEGEELADTVDLKSAVEVFAARSPDDVIGKLRLSAGA